MVLNTAQVLCEQKEYLKAEELLISQGEIIGMQPNIQYALGVTKRGQGKHEEAAKYFEKALSIDPNYAICLNTYGLLLRDNGMIHKHEIASNAQ